MRPPRAFPSEAFAEQYRAQGGPEADAQATPLRDFPGVAKVYEKNGYRTIYLCERVREESLQVEAKLSRDDLRRLNKQRHISMLALLKRIHAMTALGQSASEESYADLGRAVTELIGTPLLHASRGYLHDKAGVRLEQGESWRSSVHDLKTDLALALVRFDQMTKGELRRSREAVMRLTAFAFTEDCLTRELRLPNEGEIRDHLVSQGLCYSGSTQRSIERQWNHLLKWWRHVFEPDE